MAFIKPTLHCRSSYCSKLSKFSATSLQSSRRYVTSVSGSTGDKKERVVILGSGWAGYGVARTLDPKKFERIVISPRSYFVFTPLLASTSVGTLEFRTVLEPVRRLGLKFHQGWADDIDFTHKTVRVEANTADDLSSKILPPPMLGIGGSGKQIGPNIVPKKSKGEIFEVPYDKLVIAVGAYSQTFGIEGVRQHAHFLRDVGDARRIRLRVLSLFEQCSYPDSQTGLTDDDKWSLLHFAVVGGGPTGVEFAAELHDLIEDDLSKLYPELMKFVRITVYDVAPRILPMFDQALAKYAMDTFARHNIKVETEHHLQRIREDESGKGILRLQIKEYGEKEVGIGMVVWSTGLMQNPLVEKLGEKKFKLPGANNDGRPNSECPNTASEAHLLKDPKMGGIITDPHLRAKIANDSDENAILPDVFVIGDCAILEDDKTLPKTAQVASQQSKYLAKGLNKETLETKPFKFRNWGTMTYVGGWKAIHQSKADELRGWVAWVLWRTAYLTKSMSLRNKIMVPVYWAITWLFGRDVSRF